MRMRSRGDVYGDERARALTRVCDMEPTKTQTAAALDCDINIIAKRFGIDVSGPLPVSAVGPEYYGDFDMGMTLVDAISMIEDAKDKFMMHPPDIRAKFNNSPAQFYDWVHDPSNFDEAVSLGLFVKPPEGSPGARSAAEPPPGSPPAP